MTLTVNPHILIAFPDILNIGTRVLAGYLPSSILTTNITLPLTKKTISLTSTKDITYVSIPQIKQQHEYLYVLDDLINWMSSPSQNIKEVTIIGGLDFIGINDDIHVGYLNHIEGLFLLIFDLIILNVIIINFVIFIQDSGYQKIPNSTSLNSHILGILLPLLEVALIPTKVYLIPCKKVGKYENFESRVNYEVGVYSRLFFS